MSDTVSRLNEALTGRYRIERELGEGGMATVYLADDLRHERKVAIKVLRPELAAVIGAERFLAEIKTTANLQHPHILPLHDSGEANGLLFYVMPFVEGETLRQRLARTKQLPVEEAVNIARKVLSALQYAHERDIVHRDVKPANILLSGGEPLVADFGIALAVSQAGDGRMTETGISLGTPHYMSPEQVSGDREVDPRSDVYALGCVLHEMLAGEPPFSAPTAQGVLLKILTEDPPSISDSRKTVPANVAEAIGRSLERLPADRFTDAASFSRALADPGFRRDSTGAAEVATSYPAAPVFAFAAILALVSAAAAWGWLRSTDAVGAPSVGLSAVLPEGHRLSIAQGRAFPLAVSHEGRSIAYVGDAESGTRLYFRRLDDRYAETGLEDTEGARQPFFSWDDRWIGYFADGSLYRVSISGGAPIEVAELPDVPLGGAWGPDDLIVFGTPTGLWRVGIDGGSPERIPVSGTGRASWPSFLPEGAGRSEKPWLIAKIGAGLHAVSPEDGESRPLGIDVGGHGLYFDGTIVASRPTGVVELFPFDLRSLEVTGPSVSVLDNVFRPNLTDAVLLRVSSTGTLVYVAGADERRLVLVDRQGRQTPLSFLPADYRFPAVSPDGLRFVVSERTAGLLVFDLTTGRRQSFAHLSGVWSPAGDELVVSSGRSIARQPLSPGASPVPIVEAAPTGMYPFQWTGDGTIMIHRIDPNARDPGGLYTTRVDGDGTIDGLLDSPANETGGRISPDGAWLAYASDVSGRNEIYLRRYPDGPPRQVSVDGGFDPLWSTDGTELFYLNGEQVLAVPAGGLESRATAAPEPLFRGSYVTMLGPGWAVRPQGDFLMMSAGPYFLREIRVIQNWGATLREKLTGGSN